MLHGRRLLLALLLLGAAGPALGGETPPAGPPWQASWREAQRDAARKGRPVFLYFTKSH